MLKTIICLSVLWVAGNAAPSNIPGPTAQVRNGTYVGVRNDNFQQDFFLGMPYAQQPIGNLRFTVPQSLNESWDGVHDAKKYSNICVGYGVSNVLTRYACSRPPDWQTNNEYRRIQSGIRCPKLVLP